MLAIFLLGWLSPTVQCQALVASHAQDGLHDDWQPPCARRAKQEKAAAAETEAMADITTNLDASERFQLPSDEEAPAAGGVLHPAPILLADLPLCLYSFKSRT